MVCCDAIIMENEIVFGPKVPQIQHLKITNFLKWAGFCYRKHENIILQIDSFTDAFLKMYICKGGDAKIRGNALNADFMLGDLLELSDSTVI